VSFRYSIDGDKIPDGMEYNVDGDLVPEEPDHNYPKPATIATHVGMDDTDALYIYVPNEHGMPPNKHMQYVERVREGFEIAFPGRTIIAGPSDLKFTTLSKKQEFKGKLDGSLLNDD
jgi:hypothetical protein